MNISWNATRKLLESGLIENNIWFFIIILAGLLTLTFFCEILFSILNGKGFQQETENYYKIILSKNLWNLCLQFSFCKKMVRMISNELAKVSSLYKVQGVPGMVRYEIVQNKWYKFLDIVQFSRVKFTIFFPEIPILLNSMNSQV